ncbi:MAG: hypothetical protein KKE23_02685 [Nanoarchaeota archaeon]|nr:hypothetical protein [Nanoarchaeota archaeon]
MQCSVCKGKGLCGKPCPILAKMRDFYPKLKTEFSGSSPPEIFVGRHNYPFMNVGILSPMHYGDTEKLSMPEKWFEMGSSIPQILSYRSSLIYSKFISYQNGRKSKFLEIMQEVAMASKSTALEFKLKKKPVLNAYIDSRMPLIGNPAPLQFARFEENSSVNNKVEKAVNDTDVRASTSIDELHGYKIPVSNIIKLLSAGLLGTKLRRKLVPTRWAITSVDSNLSEKMIDKVRYYPTINSYLLFNAEYLGNHYEIIMLPRQFSFEVLEAKMPGSIWNPELEMHLMQDYENWYGRKDYASSVGGGYYAVRLPISEHLSKIRKQASILVLRECRKEYYAPCGVGILREVVKNALSKKPEAFDNLNEALAKAQTRMLLPIEIFKKRSKLLSEVNIQKTLVL